MKPPIRPCRTKKKSDKEMDKEKEKSESKNVVASTDGPPQAGQDQIQYGKQNFEKSQRHLAIKAIAIPDQSEEGNVGTVFEGFIEVEGGLKVKEEDMIAIKRLESRNKGGGGGADY